METDKSKVNDEKKNTSDENSNTIEYSNENINNISKVENKLNSDEVVITTVTSTEKKVYDLISFFAELFNETDKLNDLKIKLSYKIDDSIINLIKIIKQSSPDSLKDISNLFEEISADGKLNINDVPKIVLFIAELYNSKLNNVLKKNNLTASNVLELIKFIIHSAVELDLVNVEDKVKIFQVLDLSLSLLNTTIQISALVSIKNACSKFFSKINCSGFKCCNCSGLLCKKNST
jgi:hypothetical protein